MRVSAWTRPCPCSGGWRRASERVEQRSDLGAAEIGRPPRASMTRVVALALFFFFRLVVGPLAQQVGLVQEFLEVRHDAVAAFARALAEGPRFVAQPLLVIACRFVAHDGGGPRVDANLGGFKLSISRPRRTAE